MSLKFLEHIHRKIIVNIDNFQNVNLSDSSYIRYLVSSLSEENIGAFYSRDLKNASIIRSISSHQIILEAHTEYEDKLIEFDYDLLDKYAKFNPDAIVVDFSLNNIEHIYNRLRQNYDGVIVGRVKTKISAVEAYRKGIDALLVSVSKDNINSNFISEVVNDINIRIICESNKMSSENMKSLISIGMYGLIIGEDITDPNRIIEQLMN